MKTILIVDDEFSIVETLAEILSWEGFATVTAEHGQAALERLSAGRPDLILLDYMMPVMDGLQLLRALKDDPTRRDIPVVLMTAAPLGLREAERRWDALLIKPFGADDLLRTVRKLLAV